MAQPGISQLEGLDIPEGLKQFIGSMVTEIDELKKDRDAICNTTQVVQAENVALQADMRAQINNGIKDVELLRAELQEQNNSKAALRIEVQELRTVMYWFLSKTDTDMGQLMSCRPLHGSISARQTARLSSR